MSQNACRKCLKDVSNSIFEEGDAKMGHMINDTDTYIRMANTFTLILRSGAEAVLYGAIIDNTEKTKQLPTTKYFGVAWTNEPKSVNTPIPTTIHVLLFSARVLPM